MAGAGYKLFNTGDVLTAAQVNTYLQEQVVMVFANATARTTALSGVLAEGMVSYLKDTNATEVYDGSAWVGIGNSGDITGVTAGTGISGGGTSGTVTITNDMATTITAAGDIVVGTGSGTYDNLPIGTTGQVLTADTTVSPYKVKWATAAASGGDLVHIATTTLSSTATNFTFSSISSSYQNLLLTWQVRGDYAGNNVVQMTAQLNADTGSNYWTAGAGRYATAGGSLNLIFGTGTSIDLGYIPAAIPDAKYMGIGQMIIPNYKNTTLKKGLIYSNASYSDAPSYYSAYGGWNSTNAITEIKLNVLGGNFIVGSSVSLYGLKA